MLPDIDLFGKRITLYAICSLIGILVVFAFHQIYTKKKGHNEIFMLFVLLFASIGVFIGGHILYAITMSKYIVAFFQNVKQMKTFEEVLKWLITIFGGSVFYGGLIGGIVVAYFHLRKQKFDVDPYIGIGTLCIPLFHFFGRIGCFLSGCCYGIESKFGFYFKYSSAPGCQGVRRFPVQLLEAFILLIIFGILFYLYDRKKKSGKSIFILYLLLYSFSRFFIEFLRGDEYRGFVGILSTSQFISVIIFSLVIIYLIISKIKIKHYNKI